MKEYEKHRKEGGRKKRWAEEMKKKLKRQEVQSMHL